MKQELASRAATAKYLEKKRSIPPTAGNSAPASKLKIYLPTKRHIKRSMKKILEFGGTYREALYYNLIRTDASLDIHTRRYRWNFVFRFCAWFVQRGTKIRGDTLISSKVHEKLLSVKQFGDLEAFLTSKGIRSHLLDKSLSPKAVIYFNAMDHQRCISTFVYAFCAFLYAFLPKEKQKIKMSFDPESFIWDNASDSDKEEEGHPIKQEQVVHLKLDE